MVSTVQKTGEFSFISTSEGKDIADGNYEWTIQMIRQHWVQDTERDKRN